MELMKLADGAQVMQMTEAEIIFAETYNLLLDRGMDLASAALFLKEMSEDARWAAFAETGELPTIVPSDEFIQVLAGTDPEELGFSIIHDPRTLDQYLADLVAQQ